MEIGRAVALGRALLAEHGLDGWRLVLDNAKTRAGLCNARTREISISRPLTRLHSEAEVRDTLLHEIAHALVGPQHGHDGVWRARALAIGCSGTRCIDPGAPRVLPQWVGTCPRGHRVERHRRPARAMSCARCSRSFSPEHLLSWRLNGPPAASPAPATAIPVGSMVAVTAEGAFHGRIGIVEFAGIARAQVRLDDELFSIPLRFIQPVSGAERATW